MINIYPNSPGSIRLNPKLRFAEPPSCWVGKEGIAYVEPLPPIIDVLTGASRCSFDVMPVETRLQTASIKVDPNDKPVRPTITGRKVFVTGSYPSFKARRPISHESMNELVLYRQNEVDPGVHNYRAQPALLKFSMDGKLRSYLPDCCRQLVDNSFEIIEVKT
ncbi:hypothetical protein, partial [Asticcacaulis sp. AC466]|uniref:hypothetical protein n=1 Tax=Asticcacaulis sp. AC466 TaxID=1282362 RepID=UPI001F4448DD